MLARRVALDVACAGPLGEHCSVSADSVAYYYVQLTQQTHRLGGQKSEVRSQRSEVRSQRSAVGGQKSELRDQTSNEVSYNLLDVKRPPSEKKRGRLATPRGI